MAGLRMTERRLELLRAIDAGAVTEHYWPAIDPSYSQLDQDVVHGGWAGHRGRYVTVTGRVDELDRAGLCQRAGRVHPGYKAPRLWVLTPAGRAVLDGHRHG